MSYLEKYIYATLLLILFTGCTKIITAPISLAGSVVGTGIDVTSTAVSAAIPDDED